MDVFLILLLGLFLYFIIFFSVKAAIIGALSSNKPRKYNSEQVSLVKLRDMGVINNEELENICKFYNNKSKTKNVARDKYYKILYELRDSGHINEDDFKNKVEQLDKFYNKTDMKY